MLPPVDVCVVARIECYLNVVVVLYCIWSRDVCGGEGGYVCGYVLSRTSKIGLCVSVCVSFNCNTFVVSLYISNRSRVFNLYPFFSICRIFMVWSNVLYASPVSSICCVNFELCLLVLISCICSLKRA
jgi:hypothetical protein